MTDISNVSSNQPVHGHHSNHQNKPSGTPAPFSLAKSEETSSANSPSASAAASKEDIKEFEKETIKALADQINKDSQDHEKKMAQIRKDYERT